MKFICIDERSFDDPHLLGRHTCNYNTSNSTTNSFIIHKHLFDRCINIHTACPPHMLFSLHAHMYFMFGNSRARVSFIFLGNFDIKAVRGANIVSRLFLIMMKFLYFGWPIAFRYTSRSAEYNKPHSVTLL